MCRKVLVIGVLIALLLSGKAIAVQYAFRVTFSDKNNTTFSLSTPSAYLSARSVLRRTIQGIALDSTDLPVNSNYVDSVLFLTGGILHGTSKWFNTCVILLPDSVSITNLAGVSFISDIRPVAYYSTLLHLKPTGTTGGGSSSANPVLGKTTSFNAAYYSSTWDQTQLVRGNFLHDQNFMGQGKLIAVFDAGFINSNTNHGFDSLRQSGRLIDSFDFVRRGTNILQADNHGALALSTMAGYWPGTYVGTAPKAMYALYITEDNSRDQLIELDNLLFASERADSIGADVISESVGYDLFDYPPGAGQVFSDLDGKTTLGARTANMATKKGMIFVATAGNDGSPVPGWGNHILTPGDADSALTIGSADISGNPASSSGYGPNAAGHIKPDVCGMGHPATVLGSVGSEASDGTSFSTPQIAGWAACLWQANPAATPYQIRQAIIKCASRYTTPGNQIGYGVPNFECTQQILSVTDVPTPFSSDRWAIASPNPFNDELKLSLNTREEGLANFVITDVSGREVYSTQQYMDKGYNKPLQVSLAHMAAGIYILKVTSGAQVATIKVEKL